MKIYHKSDFDFVLHLTDCDNAEIRRPFPDCDWDAVFWTGSKANSYTASRRGDVYANCAPTTDGGMHFVFDNHRLGAGILRWQPHFALPDNAYPDGKRDVYREAALDVELTDGQADCPTTADITAMLPYLPLKFQNLTEAEKAEIAKPAADAADAVAKLESGIISAETAREKAEQARIAAEQSRQTAETARQTAESDRQTAETARQTAEQSREQSEANRVAAESQRAETFAGWRDAIAAKQDALSDSADITVSADNELSLTDKAKYATFDAQWTAIGGTVVESGKAYSINGGNGTFADAVKALSYYSERPLRDMTAMCFGKTLKLLPTFIVQNSAYVVFSNAFQSLYGIDKVVIKSTLDGGPIYADNLFAAFNSSSVKEIDCILDVSRANWVTTAFVYCRMEKIKLRGLKSDVSFHYANKLSLDSVQYMVANAANTSAITITVHPDVYAKLTGDTTNAAAAALAADVLAQWQQVLADAMAKNISFATT